MKYNSGSKIIFAPYSNNNVSYGAVAVWCGWKAKVMYSENKTTPELRPLLARPVKHYLGINTTLYFYTSPWFAISHLVSVCVEVHNKILGSGVLAHSLTVVTQGVNRQLTGVKTVLLSSKSRALIGCSWTDSIMID